MIDPYDKLVGLIYDGVTDGACWNLALAQIANLKGAVGVGLGMQDMRTHEFWNLAAFGIDPGLSQTYRRLAPGNRIWQEIGRRRQPLTDRMVMPKAAFLKTELFADWFRPQGFYSVMAHPALFKDSASAVVVAFRGPSRRDFEADDLMRLGRLAKHFGRALSFRLERQRNADELAATQLMLDAGDAVFLVDRDLRLLHANAPARTMLEAGGAIRTHKHRLELQNPETQANFERLASAARGEFRLMGSGRPELIVRLHPCAESFTGAGARYLTVRISDLSGEREQPTPRKLRDRLQLTRRQSEAIAALAAGATEKEAAEALGLGAPTLHTHVRRAYEKLDLSSRAELMALLGRHGFETGRRRKIT